MSSPRPLRPESSAANESVDLLIAGDYNQQLMAEAEQLQDAELTRKPAVWRSLPVLILLLVAAAELCLLLLPLVLREAERGFLAEEWEAPLPHSPPPPPAAGLFPAAQCSGNVSRVFITGVAGMIGSHVARELLQTRPCYRLYGLVRPRSDLSTLAGVLQRLTLVEGDITDGYRMTALLADIRPDFLYHFAAQAINGISYGEPEVTMTVNVQGTLHLLEALRQLRLTQCRFFLAGSSTEYGRSADTWQGAALPETAELQPVTPYGVSKVAAEAEVRQYALSFGLQVVVGRFFIQVGPGGTSSLAIQQFARQIAMAEQGLAEPVVRHGNLDTSRDISDASDSAPAVVAVLERGVSGEAYNIGSGIATSMRSLLQAAIDLSSISINASLDAALYRVYDEKALLADVAKLRAATGWRPSFRPRRTVLRILNYWRQTIARLYQLPPPPVNATLCAEAAEAAVAEAEIAAVSSSASQLVVAGPVNSSAQLLVPLADCPFGDVDLLLIVIQRDLPLVAHLMQSVDLFMPCYGFLHIVTDGVEDERRLRAWMRVHERVRFHRMAAPANLSHLDGYLLQMWKANWADRLVSPTARFVMMMDTDSLFTLPVTCRSLFDGRGRPHMLFWGFDSQMQFVQPCQDMVGGCVGSFMAFFPITFPVSMFAPMREHTRQRLSGIYNASLPDFDSAFADWTHRVSYWRAYSQFVNMGNFLLLHQPDAAHFVYYPHLNALNASLHEAAHYLPPAVHYGWRYCDYLGSCTHDPHTRDGTIPAFGQKYGLNTIHLIEELLQQGHCLQQHMRTGLLADGCDAQSIADVHVEAKVYQGRPHDMSYLYEVYRPEVLPSQCSFTQR